MPDPMWGDDAPNREGGPGTLFPEMGENGSPGDAEKGSDITGLILKDLDEPEGGEYGDSDVSRGSNLSSVPGGGEDPYAAPTNDGVQVAGGEIEPPQSRSRRSARDRISQLTKKYRQEQDARGQLELQLGELVQTLRAQSEELRALRSSPHSARPNAQQAPADELGLGTVGGDAPNYTPNQSFSANDIAGIVDKAIAKHMDGWRQASDAQNRLKVAHDQSFREAADEFPELADARTKAHKLFMELYNQSPLRQLEDAPYQIALQVRGILADEARDPRSKQNAEARKVQASVVPVASQPPISQGQAQLGAMEKRIKEVSHEMQMGNPDPRLYIEWRKLDRRIKDLKRKR